MTVVAAITCAVLVAIALSRPQSPHRLRRLGRGPTSGMRVPMGRGRAEKARAEQVRAFVTAVEAELRTGRTVQEALDAAWLDVGMDRMGMDTDDVLDAASPVSPRMLARHADPRLRRVGLVLDVSEDTGAPAGPALAWVLESLAQADDLRRLIATEVAAPRLTAGVLAVLPAFGWAVGMGLGADPVGWLIGSPLGIATLVIGVAMQVAGVLCIHRLAGSVRP